MAQHFWNNLPRSAEALREGAPRPFFCLAPMAEVTDAAFRFIIAKYGKPDVMWTEFVSVEGLASAKGRDNILLDLRYDEKERPIVAQVFGADPEKFRQAAELIQELGFDGVDINMGCPNRGINKQRAGADLINDPELAQKIIFATKIGAGKIPVSIKTRLGWDRDTLEEWLPVILETEPAAVTVHGRTRKELSFAPARWDRIAQAKEIARERGSNTLIIGNGDVTSLVDARQKAEKYGVDGVMIGRAVFGNPWFFNSAISRETLPFVERMKVLLEHARLFEELVSCIGPTQTDVGERLKYELLHISGDAVQSAVADVERTARQATAASEHATKLYGAYCAEAAERSNEEIRRLRGSYHKSFAVMRKHFKAYTHGYERAKELRLALMQTNNADEVEQVLALT